MAIRRTFAVVLIPAITLGAALAFGLAGCTTPRSETVSAGMNRPNVQPLSMKRSVGFSGSRIAPGTLVLEAVSEKPWSRFATRSDTAPDATSAATEQVDEVSGATESLEDTSAEGCLKCHGPFETLAGKTKDYVTEWDEKANPHMYVPHESSTIVECTECHAPHRLPYAEEPDAKKPGVGYCYACHHTESLVHCSQCHNE